MAFVTSTVIAILIVECVCGGMWFVCCCVCVLLCGVRGTNDEEHGESILARV